MSNVAGWTCRLGSGLKSKRKSKLQSAAEVSVSTFSASMFVSAHFQHYVGKVRADLSSNAHKTRTRLAQNSHTARTKRAHGSHKTRTRLAQNAHTTRTKRAHGSHKTRTNWSGLNIQKSAPCDSWPYCLILYIMEYQFFRILKFYQFLPYRLLILSI